MSPCLPYQPACPSCYWCKRRRKRSAQDLSTRIPPLHQRTLTASAPFPWHPSPRESLVRRAPYNRSDRPKRHRCPPCCLHAYKRHYRRNGQDHSEARVGQIGKKTSRERVCQDVYISVVAVSIKKKTQDQ